MPKVLLSLCILASFSISFSFLFLQTTNSDLLQTRCNQTIVKGQAFEYFIERLPPGYKGCLRSGTYNIGDFNDFKSNHTIRPVEYMNGKKAKVIIKGEIRVNQPGLTFEDIYFRGTTSHSVIDVKSDYLTLRRIDVSADKKLNQTMQGIMIGGSGIFVRGFKLIDSKIHHIGGDGQFDHGIYCSHLKEGIIKHNWIYSNSSYGIQFYPNCDNLDFSYNVVDNNGRLQDSGSTPTNQNGRGIVYGGENTQSSDNVSVHNSIISSFDHISRPVINCSGSPGSYNKLFKNIIYQAKDNFYNGCRRKVKHYKSIFSFPYYQNRKTNDYRLKNKSKGFKLLGKYARKMPGPQN